MSRLLGATLLSFVLVAGLYHQAQGQAADLLSSLVACWEMTELEGTRYDWWGTYDLTEYNTVGNAPGLVNTVSADFVAANSEYFSVADADELRATNTIHFVAWAYPSGFGASRGILGKYASGTQGDWEYRLVAATTPRWRWLVADGASSKAVETYTISAGTWQMMDAYIDGSTGQIGIAANNETHDIDTVGSIVTSTVGLKVGRDAATYWYFDGRLGPIMLFDKVLSTAERDFLWNSGDGISCAALTGNTGQTYAVEQISLPSGRTGSVEMRLSVGDIAIATVSTGILILAIFALMRDTVRSSKVADK